jgi:hypothetical protein
LRHGEHFTFERVAVTPEQIVAWDLPTRPDKKSGDPAVEVDAIPPNQLRDMCRHAIERHVDANRWRVLQKIEAEERRGLVRLAARGLNGGAS